MIVLSFFLLPHPENFEVSISCSLKTQPIGCDNSKQKTKRLSVSVK
jgi:hypothetical protein